MGYKIDHASTSKLRHALDLFLADPADSPILDDQTVSDILESGSYPLLDPSTADIRDDKDKVYPSHADVLNHDTLTNKPDSMGNDAENDDVTSGITTIRAKVMMEKITEGTTMQHRYQPKAARVSRARRLLNWFMSRFGAV